MGHETKFFVVIERHTNYAHIVASFDLSCLPEDGAFHKAEKSDFKGDIYIESDDYETTEDLYGETLKVFELKDFIKILEKEDQTYRRIPAALALLRAFDNKDWNFIKIVTYGH